MPTIAKSTWGTYKKLSAWSHASYCTSIIDLGTQPWSAQYPTPKRVVALQFECPFETDVFEWVEKPLSQWTRFTLSTGEKARFRPVFEALFQGTPTEDDYYAIDFSKLVWSPCTITITDSGEYTNVTAVTPLTKGIVLPPMFNAPKVLDLDRWNDEDEKVFDSLGDKFKEKIMSSPEFQKAIWEEKF